MAQAQSPEALQIKQAIGWVKCRWYKQIDGIVKGHTQLIRALWGKYCFAKT